MLNPKKKAGTESTNWREDQEHGRKPEKDPEDFHCIGEKMSNKRFNFWWRSPSGLVGWAKKREESSTGRRTSMVCFCFLRHAIRQKRFPLCFLSFNKSHLFPLPSRSYSLSLLKTLSFTYTHTLSLSIFLYASDWGSRRGRESVGGFVFSVTQLERERERERGFWVLIDILCSVRFSL